MSDAPAYQRDPAHHAFVTGQLAERSHVTGERAVAVVRARATRRFQMEAEADGFTFRSDEPVRGGGDGTGPAPLRYFVGGYICCHEVWCIKMAAVLGVHLTRVEGEAQGCVASGSPPDPRIGPEDAQGLSRVLCRLTLDTAGAGDEEVREVVVQAAYRCPAAVTLWKAIPLDVEIVHNGRSLGTVEMGPRGG